MIELWINEKIEPLNKAEEFFFKWADITGFLEDRGWNPVWASVIGIFGSLLIIAIPILVITRIISFLKNR